MARGATYCVELKVVITNDSTESKLREAIDEVAEAAEDYPFLGLADTVERLEKAFMELTYEPDR